MTTKQIRSIILRSPDMWFYLSLDIVVLVIYAILLRNDWSFASIIVTLMVCVFYYVMISKRGRDTSPLPYAKKGDALIHDPYEDITTMLTQTEELERRQQKRNFHTLVAQMGMLFVLTGINMISFLNNHDYIAVALFTLVCMIGVIVISVMSIKNVIRQILMSDEYSRDLKDTQERIRGTIENSATS